MVRRQSKKELSLEEAGKEQLAADRKRNKARAVAERRWIGRGSRYLVKLAALLRRKPWLRRLVVLYCRESPGSRDYARNLKDQVKQALAELRKLGITPIKVFSQVETSNIYGDRRTLRKAIKYARQHGAILVADSRCRLLRYRDCGLLDKRKEFEQPTVAEYEELIRLAGGVTIATLLDPDKSARSRQTKRGQEIARQKGKKIGRPRKRKRGKNLTGAMRKQIISLWHRSSLSLNQIASKLGLPKTTVAGVIGRWIDKQLALGRMVVSSPGKRRGLVFEVVSITEKRRQAQGGQEPRSEQGKPVAGQPEQSGHQPIEIERTKQILRMWKRCLSRGQLRDWWSDEIAGNMPSRFSDTTGPMVREVVQQHLEQQREEITRTFEDNWTFGSRMVLGSDCYGAIADQVGLPAQIVERMLDEHLERKKRPA